MRPAYRDEIKGLVNEHIADFASEFRGEKGACNLLEMDNFFFCTDDEIRESEAYRTYQDYLTDKEMLRAAKKAMPA